MEQPFKSQKQPKEAAAHAVYSPAARRECPRSLHYFLLRFLDLDEDRVDSPSIALGQERASALRMLGLCGLAWIWGSQGCLRALPPGHRVQGSSTSAQG